MNWSFARYILLFLPATVFLLYLPACRNPAMLQPEPREEPGTILSLPTEEHFPDSSMLATREENGYFALIRDSMPASIMVSPSDDPGVIKVAGYFQHDLSLVSGKTASLYVEDRPATGPMVIVGTLGESQSIDRLVKEGKVDVSNLTGTWENFMITTVGHPMEGVDHALVIVGSDKRGTIFGMFELSAQMGVSPWYWWADVPVRVRRNIFVKPGAYSPGPPKVKYRGIFINDEAPALSGWAQEKFGGFNHEFYEKVYELILRLKGNYLWPAMWGSSLWDDDSLSAPLADEMGIVLATSHHEPLMRSHVEWSRYGHGPWNYEKNPEALRQFWKEGMQRTMGQEKVVTVGMRGDGDEPMTEGTAIDLLEKIVYDQREIISEVTGRPARETPQAWALYKEVQDYYDKGMRVPDDITLLLCDDNWGNVRILPQRNAPARPGGYGMYYHFDFVGGPRSYRWLNTVQIERVWEQMHLTYKYGVDRIWLVNVGDIKPMEFPISFFMDYAWDPDQLNAENLPDYYTSWARQQFGDGQALEIGEVIASYTKYNARRKPELLDTNTYSLKNFQEAERIVDHYNALAAKTRRISRKLPEVMRAAFFQLVQYPVEACANLNEMYVLAARNHLYARQHRILTNELADRVKKDFQWDSTLSALYHGLRDGKWNHLMSQVHIGYTTWADPGKAVMPGVETIKTPESGKLGVTLPGIEPWWPEAGGEIHLAVVDPVNDQDRELVLFNQGNTPVSYNIKTSDEWIRLDHTAGEITTEQSITIHIDWTKVPPASHEGTLQILSEGHPVRVIIPLKHPEHLNPAGFIENNGILSMMAEDYQNAVETKSVSWQVIPNLGRTGSAVTSLPVTVTSQEPVHGGPSLEYPIYIITPGNYDLTAYFSPTLNFQKDEGLIYAFSVDDAQPVRVNLHANAGVADWLYPAWWNQAVTNNIMKQWVLTRHLSAGPHTITYHMVDPGLVLQKFTLIRDDIEHESYLGPPESMRIEK